MTRQNKSISDWLIIFSILLLFISVGFYTVGDYGLTVDFPFHFSRGEAYLHYFLTGNKDYSDIPANTRCIFQDISFKDILAGKTIEISQGWKKGEFGTHPSLSGILSALGCTIFHRKLGFLGPVDAHHSLIIVLAAIAILVTYLFALEAYGRWVAVLSALCLALFPRFFGHAHNNFKDIPILCFATLSLWAFWKGVKHLSWKWIILFGIFLGFGMSIKFNAMWVILVIAPWLVLQWKTKLLKINELKPILFYLAICPLIAFLILYFLWPYLWADSINNLLHVVSTYASYVTRKGGGAGFVTDVGWPPWRPYYAPAYAIITTPVIILFFSTIGLVTLWKNIKKETHGASSFVILWLFTPILIFILPITLYNGIRIFMGFIPPLCIVAAIGASESADFLKTKYFNKISPYIINIIIYAIMIIPLLVVNIRTHPNQVTYFNLLSGGLSGAQKTRLPFTDRIITIPDAWDYWRNSYRNGVKWLNENAEPDSYLTMIDYKQHVVIGANELREDIKLRKIKSLEQIKNRSDSSPGYIMFIARPWFYSDEYIVEYCRNNLSPVYSITSQGAPVLLIYKY